jgi:quercetin dioxygenase-like cupin family protein
MRLGAETLPAAGAGRRPEGRRGTRLGGLQTTAPTEWAIRRTTETSASTCKDHGVSHRVVDVEDIEPGGPGGAVRFVRRELGTRAFGINQFVLQPGFAGPEHDESTTGQEEVYVVIGGGGTMRVDDRNVAMRVGRYVHVDPGTPRQITAGPEGLIYLAIGAPAERPYEPRGPF